jgi:NADPH:quinone reductase-like Zn-dependent oxidoreductase
MIGGSFISRYIEGLANEASVHLVGNLEGDIHVSFPFPPLIKTGSSVTGFSIFNLSRDRSRLERAKSFILKALNEQKVKPIIDRVWEFPDTVNAYHHMGSGDQRGKIVIRVSSEADQRV